MAGCFGGSAIDRWMENSLNSYLDAGDADEEAFAEAENSCGACIYQKDDLYIFEDGSYGYPTLEEDADEDGYYMTLGGLSQGYIHKTKDGGYLFKATRLVPSKRKSPKPFRGYKKEVVDFFIRIPA
jgi:hypothetical protein